MTQRIRKDGYEHAGKLHTGELAFSAWSEEDLPWHLEVNRISDVWEHTEGDDATGNDALDLDLLCSSRRQPICLQSSKRVLEDMILRVGSIGYYQRGTVPKLSSFSNYGPNHTEILAPGEEIPAMLPSGRAVLSSGTSPAAAIISGAVTLMVSCRPNALASEIKKALLDSADRYEVLQSKVKEGRVLNIFKTIKTFCLRSSSLASQKHRDSRKDKSDTHTSDL